MRDFKIQFEAETGVRLPMIGRRDPSGKVRMGWVQLLREFHKEAFYGKGGRLTEIDRYNYEEMAGLNSDWRDLANGLVLCRRCAANGGKESYILPKEGVSAHRCLRWVGREEAVTRAAKADAQWRDRLERFIKEKTAQVTSE